MISRYRSADSAFLFHFWVKTPGPGVECVKSPLWKIIGFMLWTLTKSFRFEAAHFLPKHDGKCQRLHGHSWVGRVILASNALHEEGPKAGMVLDFGDVSAAIRPLLERYLDHWCLNQTLVLENPTSEEVARWVYVMLKPQLPLLAAIEIDETCTSSARYQP